MKCAQLEGDRWRLSFSEPEASFIVNVLARLARLYQDDLSDLPPAVRAYWQGSIAESHKTAAGKDDYALALALVAGISAVVIALWTWFGPEARGKVFGVAEPAE